MSNDLIKRDDALAKLEGKMTKTIEERRWKADAAARAAADAADAAYAGASTDIAAARAAWFAYADALAELAKLEGGK